MCGRLGRPAELRPRGIAQPGPDITRGRRQIVPVASAPELPEVVAGINRRDPVTLDRIARSHLPALRRAARAAGLGEDDADDAVQAALLVFIERAEDFDGRAPVLSWLMGILYRKLQEHRRSLGREEPASARDDEFERRFDSDGMWIRPPVSPEVYTAAKQAMTWLAGCLEQLADRRRFAFQLREIEQLDTAEICKILDVSPNTLGVILFRARNALRECMETKGFRGAADVEM